MSSPIICFGQQPSGFFPKRFLVAKIFTARKLQQEIGGEIVFFYHDSDHDPRETRTVLRHRKTNEPAMLNFTFENKLQRKFSPLYAKRIPEGWQNKTSGQLPNYVEHKLINMFKETHSTTVAEFCLEMYERMGLLDGIKVLRSSDTQVRDSACDVDEFFVDIERDGEIVRARHGTDGSFKLHEGGDVYVDVPAVKFGKRQISPTRDSRLKWMQSVINCTHYITGAGEANYLRKEDAPEIKYVTREEIERSDEAYIDV